MGKLYLDLPYEHIEDLESYGCYFDEGVNKWCYEGNIENYINLCKFFMKRNENREIENSAIVCNNLFVLEGEAVCPCCGKKTKVITFGVSDFIEYRSGENESINEIYQTISEDEDFYIVEFNLSELPEYIYDYLLKKYNFEYTIEDEFYDKCQHCGKIVDYHKMSEENPFFILFNPARVENVKIYKIPLKYDIIVNSFDCNYDEGDYFFYLECKMETIEL